MRRVSIHYRRPPGRETVFDQIVLEESPQVVVTFQPSTELPRPVTVAGRTVLEPGSPAVWFTFPGRWHDIGRFHTADGTFTGLYANILTPVEATDDGSGRIRWETTDLFLDVFRFPSGEVRVVDADELAEAEAAGAVTTLLAARARKEASELVARVAAGEWPPPIVDAWPLERALAAFRGG